MKEYPKQLRQVRTRFKVAQALLSPGNSVPSRPVLVAPDASTPGEGIIFAETAAANPKVRGQHAAGNGSPGPVEVHYPIFF